MVLLWIAELAHALQYCHRTLRVLHRDLKPSNVFLTEDLQVRLGDFGIARSLGSTRSLCNTFIGTQVYMSPEVLRMQQYGMKSDVWGLGMIMYEACALERMFRNANPLALVQAIVSPERPPPFPARANYSQELQDLIFEMLEKDVERRPTLSELMARRPILRREVEELERRLDWEPSLVPPPDFSSKSRIWGDVVIEEEDEDLDSDEDGEKTQEDGSTAPTSTGAPAGSAASSNTVLSRSREELKHLSIRELKELLTSAGGDPSAYLEKGELVEAVWLVTEGQKPEAIESKPPEQEAATEASTNLPSPAPASASSPSPAPATGGPGGSAASPQLAAPEAAERPGLAGFAEAAAQRLTFASSRDVRVKGAAGREAEVPATEEVSAPGGERGWGQLPPPAPPAEPPPWWRPPAPEKANDAEPDDEAAAEAVCQAAKVDNLVELTHRRKELEEVLAKAPFQEAFDLEIDLDDFAMAQEQSAPFAEAQPSPTTQAPASPSTSASKASSAGGPSPFPPLPTAASPRPDNQTALQTSTTTASPYDKPNLTCNTRRPQTPQTPSGVSKRQQQQSSESGRVAEARATMLLGARLRTVQLLEKQAPDPAELSQALRRNREMELLKEECGQALLAHAHRISLKAEDAVIADEHAERATADRASSSHGRRAKSRVKTLEPAAEVLETVAPEAGGCPAGLLERAQGRLQQAQEQQQKVGLRCRCGPVVRLLSVDQGSSLQEVRGQVAKRFQRPEDGLVLTVVDGQSTMTLEQEEQWQTLLRTRRGQKIELEVPQPARAASGSGAAAARRKRGKATLAGLAASSGASFGFGRPVSRSGSCDDAGSALSAARLQQQRVGGFH
eukprot:TRINITY_DN7801_c0_g1_i2.p1 TRINITY_DN7801_c0_g1~~TRINITY_DN7801_c0_g1_i2.p1  ORF type:complete len:982 (-),score=244.75 TRINITY_DN7801_c0_g1_i2:75-2618(-)